MDKNKLMVCLINRVRKGRGMGIAELARRIGVESKHLCNVFNHKTKMQIDEFFRICCVLDVSVGFLIGESHVLEGINEGRIHEASGFEFVGF